jgi:hypothetical protein
VARYEVVFDVAKAASPKSALNGATVSVRIPGTTVNIPDTIFADRNSSATLANPFTCPSNGAINFYLAAPRLVDLVITPAGQPAQTQPAVQVNKVAITSQVLARNGVTVNWVPA